MYKVLAGKNSVYSDEICIFSTVNTKITSPETRAFITDYLVFEPKLNIFYYARNKAQT